MGNAGDVEEEGRSQCLSQNARQAPSESAHPRLVHARRRARPQRKQVYTGPTSFPSSKSLQGGTGENFITLEILYLDRGKGRAREAQPEAPGK